MSAAGRRVTTRTDGPDDEIDVIDGRVAATWTDVKDWVLLSGVSPQAVCLYALLRMHERSGEPVDAARIASLMGVSRSDKVGRWVRELVDLGAVSVARQGPAGRNAYVTHDEPPPGHPGPRSLAEYNREAERTGAAGAPVVYYLGRPDGAIKIGHTTDLAARVARLHLEHLGAILLAFEPGTEALEAQRHHEYQHARLLGQGEWFRPDPALLTHVSALVGRAA